MTSEAKPRNYWGLALAAAVAIVAIGGLSGYASNSGYSNAWFAALDKPDIIPPGWVFGAVWTTLYTLMGLALALVWIAPASPQRTVALRLFFAQLIVNFAWSPLFFGMQMIEIGLVTILVLFLLAAAAAGRFFAIRPLAGMLLVPYLAWLCMATALNFEIGRLNPGADSAPLGLFGG